MRVQGSGCGVQDSSSPSVRSSAFCRGTFAACLLLALGVGAALRLVDLAVRPMHCDEAVHAVRFGHLLEEGRYVYDPDEYHGPSLNYFSLPVAWLASKDKLTEVTEVHLRLVPAIFGIVLVALAWLVRGQMGPTAMSAAAVLAAVSPAMVFYSRYYIQEMLLVSASFAAIAALWRFAEEEVPGTFLESGEGSSRQGFLATLFRRAGWVALFGLSLGLMHASKETSAIAGFAMAVAAALTLGRLRALGWKRFALAGLAAALVAAAVSALLFSSFLTNTRGVIDSYAAFFHYLGRASGEGSAGPHSHPWHYYFRVLFWWPRGDGPVWTEGAIAVLALVGLAAAACGRGIELARLPYARFLAVYTLILTAVYAALPYKTPWCALGFLHGLILLAGVGAGVFVHSVGGRIARSIVVLALLAAVGHLAWQAHRGSFAACEDPDNPYVYAHPTEDVLDFVAEIERLAAGHPDGRDMHLAVICPDDDYWPLPWYLRSFSRVGWYNHMPEGPPAPAIAIQPQSSAALAKYLYEDQPPGKRHLYIRLEPAEGVRWLLRPHVPLEIYLRRDLWEAYQADASALQGR